MAIFKLCQHFLQYWLFGNRVHNEGHDMDILGIVGANFWKCTPLPRGDFPVFDDVSLLI
jgi:hypothetical protein